MPPFTFDPDRVAHFEVSGWRAYYDRQWLKLLRLIVALGQEQFHISFPNSLLAAYYYVTRASIAWAPIDPDTDKVSSFYTKFYRLARRHSGLTFDPAVDLITSKTSPDPEADWLKLEDYLRQCYRSIVSKLASYP